MTNLTSNETITQTIEILKQPEEVVEIRILKTDKGTISGYFDDVEKLIIDVQKYVGKYDIYVTLNPPKDELLARCTNRLQTYAKHTSSDLDIKEIRYVLIDIDPIRTSGISSTDDEKKAAYELSEKIRKDLLQAGFPQPIVANSGNGYHMLLPVELDNTKENVAIVKDFLGTLDFFYSNDQAQVDVTTYNPSRIVKLYGTKACKGDDTEERPHRWSGFVKVPKELMLTEIEQLKAFINKKPKLEATSKSKAKGKNIGKPIDVPEFIEKYGLDLDYSASYAGNATKYILRTCPWNSDHTNSAAYIIQFADGGVAAGCLHNGCSGEGWRTLRSLLAEDSQISDVVEEDKQADTIIKLTESFQYFINELEEPFAAVKKENHWEVLDMKSQKFKLYLTKLFFDNQRSAPGAEGLNQALKVLEMKAIFSDSEHKLQRRIAENQGSYYYDLCDTEWRVVQVSVDGCRLESHPPILFTRNKNMEQQVEPDLSVDSTKLIPLVKKHFRFKKESDTVLFATYLVTCFLPQIAHVILVLFGEKGAAKSTTMRMVKRIVDPAKQDLLSMPTSKSDLAISLSNSYMPCFDNLDSLSAEKSDMLCMAATGGAFTKRTLYSDSDETILQFKRCVGLNGINIVATRPDLLDRSILLELERIPKDERKTEHAIWRAFEADIPKFLGAIFNTISAAIPLYDDIDLQEVGRMADFTYWGYAIADVLGVGGEEFLQAYLNNQDTANEEALSSHPVAAAVIAFMKNRSTWSASVSELLKELEDVAERERINTNVKTWAKDANVLSKRLKEVKSNLEEIGITYDIRHAGNYKKITLQKKGNASVVKQTGSKKLQRPVIEEDYLKLDEEFEHCN